MKWPSREVDTSDEPVGGGTRVPPGTYTAVLTLGTHVDTMTMTVAHDPRLGFDEAAYTSASEHVEEVHREVERLSNLMQELAVAEETMKTMDGLWTLLGDSTTTELDSLQADMGKGISAIQDMLWTPEDFVGYDHVTVRVMGRLYDAMPNMLQGATANDARKLEIARRAIDEVEVEVKSLMDGTWQDMLRVARGLDITVDGVLEGVARPEE